MARLLLFATRSAAPHDWDVAWRMGICGTGFGFHQTPNNIAFMTAGPAGRSGAASRIGWSLGSAMAAANHQAAAFAVGFLAPTRISIDADATTQMAPATKNAGR
jgi:hypothetical protein